MKYVIIKFIFIFFCWPLVYSDDVCEDIQQELEDRPDELNLILTQTPDSEEKEGKENSTWIIPGSNIGEYKLNVVYENLLNQIKESSKNSEGEEIEDESLEDLPIKLPKLPKQLIPYLKKDKIKSYILYDWESRGISFLVNLESKMVEGLIARNRTFTVKINGNLVRVGDEYKAWPKTPGLIIIPSQDKKNIWGVYVF